MTLLFSTEAENIKSRVILVDIPQNSDMAVSIHS